ncbi:MAG: alpha/beta fold hydrolase [Clostridia bacterium]|nr:alpha/beta fold hydrolase [Clostridia bacterium]
MKKILSVLLALMMLIACGAAAAEQETRKIETPADAEEWIRVFLGEHPEELDGAWAMTAQMQAAADQMGGIGGLAKSLAALGTAGEIGSAVEGELSGFKTFSIPCAFSLMPVDLVLVIQDGAVAGLQTGAYSGGKEEKTESDLFDSVELNLPVPALGELPGILTMPKGDGPFPAVILIQGSGASDKDEAVMGLRPFRDIAEGLAEQGVAVYRFDKRTYVYGTVMANNRRITLMDESIDDAVNAVQLLTKQEKIDPERIFVLGHSLGGNAIPAIARELKKQPADSRGFIMMAASPRPLEELAREQNEFLYSLMPEETEEQKAEKEAFLAEMEKTFSDLDRLKDMDSLTDDDTVLGIWKSYWKWLAEYDILQAAKEITQPVLLLQGEEDYQVTMEDFSIWQETIGDKENWKLVSYPGLVHVFIPGQKAEGSAVYSRTEKVDSRVISDIADFINGK